MRRLLLAFAILAVGVALNGCAAVKVEVDDAHKGYVIYSNGKKVCDDSRNCYVPVARGDEMYLEAEKNGVVYGEVVIHRGDGGYSTQTVLHRGGCQGRCYGGWDATGHCCQGVAASGNRHHDYGIFPQKGHDTRDAARKRRESIPLG